MCAYAAARPKHQRGSGSRGPRPLHPSRARAAAPGPDGAGTRLLRDDRRAPVPELRRPSARTSRATTSRRACATSGRTRRTRPASRSTRPSRRRRSRTARRSPAGGSRSASGIAPGKVTGPWGSLSVVERAVPDRRHDAGLGPRPRRPRRRPIAPARRSPGATTIELSEDAGRAGARRAAVDPGRDDDRSRARGRAGVRRTSSASGRCAARSTTSTATTSSGSSSRPAAGTSTASRTT